MLLFENTSPFWINIASTNISTDKEDLCTKMSRLLVLSALAILCASLGGAEGFWVTPPTVEECKSKMSERDLNGTVSIIFIDLITVTLIPAVHFLKESLSNHKDPIRHINAIL